MESADGCHAGRLLPSFQYFNNFCRGRCKGLVPDLGQEAAGHVLWGHRFVLYHLE